MAKKKTAKSSTSPLRIIYKLPLLLFFPAAILLRDWGSDHPDQIERVYSTSIYPAISQPVSQLFGVVPFSFAEILLYAIIILIPLGLIIAISYGSQNRHAGYSFFNYVVILLSIVSIMYFVFIGGWGLNYSREPLANTLNFDTRPRSTEALSDLCIGLINDAKIYRSQLDEDRDGVLTAPYEYRETAQNVVKVFANLGEDYPAFSGKYSAPKPVWQSEKMCYTEITGVYIPFTVEANVNVAVPPMSLAATACHEAAHQRGFAREDEANFIAYWVSDLHGDVYFKYSATMLALSHSMNALYAHDPDAFSQARTLYSPAMNRDVAAKAAFWKQYEGEIAEKAEEVNNTYLESNHQTDGVKSYGRMVDLLLAYRRLGD